MVFTEKVTSEEALNMLIQWLNKPHLGMPLYRGRRLVPTHIIDMKWGWEIHVNEYSKRSGRLMAESGWDVSRSDYEWTDASCKVCNVSVGGLYYYEMNKKGERIKHRRKLWK